MKTRLRKMFDLLNKYESFMWNITLILHINAMLFSQALKI